MIKKAVQTIRDIFELEELRSRLTYTLFILFIYRLGTHLVLPGLNPAELLGSQMGVKSILDSLLGGSLNTYSILALGITPYISASIMIQMLSLTIPYFQRLNKEGVAGRAKKTRITRILSLFTAVAQSIPYLYDAYYNQKAALLVERYYLFGIGCLLIVSGTMFSIWLSDRITEKGIGNGTSVLIMAGIISNLPGALYREYDKSRKYLLFLVFEFLILFFLIFILIAFMQGVRKIHLQYARQIGRTRHTYQSNREYLPVKMNSSGVMPIIFANIFLIFILLVSRFFRDYLSLASRLENILLQQDSWQFNAAQALLVFLGTFLYTAVFTNPMEIADDLKQNNGFIPGIKPGRPTAHYIDTIITRITFPGAIFLALIAMLPALAIYFGITKEFSKFYGGTSLLIIIQAILEMVKQIESHLFMKYYERMMHARPFPTSS